MDSKSAPPPTPPASGRGEAARTAIASATQRFGFSATARLDAELLMAHAMGVSRETLLLSRLDQPAPDGFDALVTRRAAHEPIAYITGIRAFWTIELEVGPGVLVPRADSETLLEAAVAHFADEPPQRILDLGTGPGTLLLAALAEWPEATGLGVDASEAALVYARRNAERLGLANRAELRRGNWAEGISGPFDLILANPPYIGTSEELPDEVRAHEPGEALFAGPDGLDDYRILSRQIAPILGEGGMAALEIGHTQAPAVSALFAGQGLATATLYDLGNRPRAIVLKKHA